jgi:hypothetical protein
MFGLIRNFIRKFSPNLSTDGLRNTPKTNPSFPIKGRPNTALVNVPSGIETKQRDRLGFMEAEWRVPDDFNTMGASEIESMFYDNK